VGKSEGRKHLEDPGIDGRIILIIRWAVYAACMGERTCACRVLMGKSEGRRALGGPRHRWTDNIKMDLQ
jgi:hypothetical protein